MASMLLHKPKEFHRVAQEWAVIHAGAPKKYAGEGSGGATDESLRQQELKLREDQEKEDLSKYVVSFLPSPLFVVYSSSYVQVRWVP